MGRVSMPYLNKTGYSMYWNSLWDDKLNYSRSLKDGMFLKMFFNVFFQGGGSFMIKVNFKKMKRKLYYLNKNYRFQVKKIDKKNEIGARIGFKYVSKKKTKFSPFISKIWILKYQTWLVIYFFSYIFTLSRFYKKRTKMFWASKRYFNFVMLHYNSILKTKYSNAVYKSALFENRLKFVF